MRIVPGPGLIACELLNFLVDAAPEYTALSYCWGEESVDCTIEINNRPFPVRRNLFSYLHLLAEDSFDGWYFIDAICIDQSDGSRNSEKAYQVGLMGDIYRHAEEVVSWLGMNDSGGIIRRLGPELTAMLDSWEAALGSPDPDHTASAFLAISERLDLGPAYGILNGICRSPYWSRLWIVQGVLLARRLTIRFRTFHLNFQSLYLFLKNHATWGDIFRRLSGQAPTGSEMMASKLPQADFFSFLSKMEGNASRPVVDQSLEAFQSLATVSWDMRQGQPHGLFVICCKVLLEKRRGGTEIALWEIVSALGLQNCRYRHDAIYGFVGMTGSQLHVDYDMAFSTMYLRVLIDGLSEAALTKTSRTLGLSGFYGALRSALFPEGPIWDLLLAAIEVQEYMGGDYSKWNYCGQAAGSVFSMLPQILYRSAFFRSLPVGNHFALFYRPLQVMVYVYSHISKATNRRMMALVPGVGTSRAYSDWAAVIRYMCDEVVFDKCLAHIKSGKCTHLVEMALWSSVIARLPAGRRLLLLQTAVEYWVFKPWLAVRGRSTFFWCHRTMSIFMAIGLVFGSIETIPQFEEHLAEAFENVLVWAGVAAIMRTIEQHELGTMWDIRSRRRQYLMERISRATNNRFQRCMW
jgi:hypothetical protein